ncbi:MAG: rRNA biogenesis protein rrp5 [Anaerovoracaceae bacterium]
MSRNKLLLDVASDMESLTESLRTLANAIVSDEPSAESEEKPSTREVQEVKPAAKTISVEDVRAVLVPISQSGKTAQVRALLNKHGASCLSDIDPGKYASLLADAEVLANG